MTYQEVLHNSARQRAMRRRTAEQCELARVELVRMREAQAYINQLFNPCADEATVELAAIHLPRVPKTPFTEGVMPVVKVRE